MSKIKENDNSPDKQTKIKPKIEDIASDYLDGDKLTNLLNFVAWLRANKMTPTFGSKSKIGASYTTRVLYVKLSQESWYIWIAGKSSGCTDDFFNCEELNHYVASSLAPCKGCGHQCNSGKGFIKTVCGKDYDNICGCCPVRFHNPNADNLRIIMDVISKRNRSKVKE